MVEGSRRGGYDILAHVEADSNACDTLRTREAYYYLNENKKDHIYIDYLLGNITREELYSNIPSNIMGRVIEKRISESTLDDIFLVIDEQLAGKKVEIIIGGPPCQAYSTAGISRCPNNMKSDPRNYYYRYYKEFLAKYKPKLFVFENVKGILSAKKGEIYLDLKKEVEKAGYTIEYRVLNAKDFGVPQNRERVFIIGANKGVKFEYPKFKLRKDFLDVKSSLEDLPRLKQGEEVGGIDKYLFDIQKGDFWGEWVRGEFNVLTQHIARPHNSRDLEIFRRVVTKWNEEGEILKYNELPKKLQTHKNVSTFLDRYKSLKFNQLSHTIVAHIAKDGNYYIHPDIEQNRSLTVREAARIQSFPDNYYFERSRTAAFTQIGNAVPPLMALRIAEQLKRFL